MASCATSVGATGPYHDIAVRNVFGLKPVEKAQPPIDDSTAALPTVKMTGLTTIFADERVLLKITFPAQTPEPAREISCMLLEGQSVGPVEVLEIDVPAERVRICNTGRISWLTFENPSARVASVR